MQDGRKPFVVMAKPVGSRCNMRCAYCYYLEKGRFSAHEKQSRMSFSLLEKLIRQTIEASDGAVYACDHFVDDGHRLGTLSSGRLDALANSEQQIAFGDAKRGTLTAECKRCPWLACCNGGCLKDRFGVSGDGEPGQYLLCKGLKQFFAHADGPLHQVMALSSRGMKPGQIMELL